MRRKIAMGIVVVVATTIGLGQYTRLQAHDHDQDNHRSAEEMAKVMEDWMKLNQPGEHHKHLDEFVGKWKVRMKTYMGGPGADPTVSEGTATVEWALDGRFLMERFKSTFMGKPYEGLGLTGYDNFRNMYVANWHSNSQTGFSVMTGSRHPESGVFTYYGQMDEPSLNVVGRTVKYVTKVKDRNHHTFTIIDLHAGDEYKVIEIDYARIQ